jgi:hypothetical protein
LQIGALIRVKHAGAEMREGEAIMNVVRSLWGCDALKSMNPNR